MRPQLRANKYSPTLRRCHQSRTSRGATRCKAGKVDERVDFQRLSSFEDGLPNSEDSVLIAGAGLAGLCLAAALQKVNIPCYVLEQRGELSREGAAIALWSNALKALDQIGVADAVRTEFSSIENVQVCRDNGAVLASLKFSDCEAATPELIGLPRSRLQQLLFEAVDPKCLVMDATVSSVAPGERELQLEGGQVVRGRVIVGADGVRSSLAPPLGLSSPNFTGQAGYRGLAEFPGKAPVAAKTALQVWGEGYRAGLYPISDTSVYWFVTFACDESLPSLAAEDMKSDALRIVKGWKHGIVECVENTPEDSISRSRFYDRWQPPFLRAGSGSITLAGDALHPMTPNLGQGGCTALEDGIVLARLLKEVWGANDSAKTEQALREYERQRAERCFPLAMRSNLIGRVAQGSNPVIRMARDAAAPKLADVNTFFKHTLFDCGSL